MKKFFNQFIKFLFISGTGWLIDFGLYFIFTNILKYEVFYSNILSSIPAITFVFIVSVKKIFKKKKNGISIIKKYIIYFLYQILLIFLISLLGQFLYSVIIKNNVTMIINFFVMKFLTEKL